MEIIMLFFKKETNGKFLGDSLMRVECQNLWDLVAVLRLLCAVQNTNNYLDGNLKLQKLSFLAELQGYQQNSIVFHYRFFRYQYGTYSRHLANDIISLTKKKFLKGNRTLTNRGKFLLDYLGEAISQSPSAIQAFKHIDMVVEQYGRFSGARLTDLVYNLKVPVYDLENKLERVREIQTGLDILVPTATSIAKEFYPLPEDVWIDIKAEMELSPQDLDPRTPTFQKTIKEAMQRLKAATNA